MNHRKKWAGAAVAAFVALGMLGAAVPASAGAGEPGLEDDIMITGDSVAGHEFSAVRIATYNEVVVTNDSVTGFELVTLGNDDFKRDLIAQIKFILADDDDYDDTEFGAAKIDHLDPMHWVAKNWPGGVEDAWGNLNSSNEYLRDLANWLERHVGVIVGEDSEAKPQFEAWGLEPAVDTETGKLGTDEGLHFVWDSTPTSSSLETPPAPGTNPLAMIIGTQLQGEDGGWYTLDNQTLGRIEVKGDLVMIDKDIQTAIGTKDAENQTIEHDPQDAGVEGEDEDSWTATTGDVLDFVIRTNIPHYPDTYVNPTFIITDEWSDGLGDPCKTEVDPCSKALTVFAGTFGTDGILLEDGKANVTAHATYVKVAGANQFTITFDLSRPDIRAALSGKDIEVRYQAVVMGGADDENYTHDTNTAKVTFTNLWSVDATEDGVPDGGQPGDEEEDLVLKTTDPDQVDVYTFPLNVIKTDLNNPGMVDGDSGWLDATFSVKRFMDGDDETGYLVGTITTGTSADGGFIISDKVKDSDENSVEAGLALNTWYLVEEIRVPTNYTKANEDYAKFWVYITADDVKEGAVNTGLPVLGNVTGLKYYFADGSAAQPTFDPATPPNWSSPYVQPLGVEGADVAGTLNDMKVLVLNAKLNSDMPSTGGQILLIVGIAGVLGLGAITFGAVGLRKRKALAAAAA